MDATDQALNNLDHGTGEDRISNLPESILSNILSRLPTKVAVGTCILSKAWEMKWTCIYNLHFDDQLLHSKKLIDKQKFSNFVTKVLHHCGNSRYQNFTLIFSKKYHPSQVKEWISTALNHDVKCLYVRYHHHSQNFELPSSFLGCKSLQEATIILPCAVKVSQVTAFKNLKTLYITSVKFVNESNPDPANLSFIFPVLEEFTVMCCNWSNVKIITIEAPRLSTFQLECCKYENGLDQLDNCQIMILGACLTKFQWDGDFVENFILPRPPSVCEAKLDNIFDPNNFWRAGIGAVRLLNQLSTVTSLQLSIDIAEALDQAGEAESLPVLNQLTNVKIVSHFAGSTRALMAFLRKAPNVRYLEVHTSSLSWMEDDLEMIGTVPLCVMFRLKRVCFTYKFGSAVELQLAKLFLQNAHALRVIHISAPELSIFSKILIKLQLFLAQRASWNVTIVVD